MLSFTFVCHDLVSLEEEASVLKVHDLTLQLILHHINQSQLIAQVLHINTHKAGLMVR